MVVTSWLKNKYQCVTCCKNLCLGYLFFQLFLPQAGAQSFLRYEINEMKERSGVRDFPDSLLRENYLQDLLVSLQLEGYPSVIVKSKTFARDTLSVNIEPGDLYQWILLRKGNLGNESAFRIDFEEKDFQQRPFNFGNLKRLFEMVLEEAQNTGYPFASIRLDSIELQNKEIKASINLETGPFISFDTIQITGNSKTFPIYLNRLLKINPETPFSQKKVEQSVGILRSLPYVQMVNEPQLSFQNQEATLYLPLNDRPINTLDGIIGVLPNEIEGSKLLITGQFDLALYNVAGRGRNYKVNWQRLSQYSQNLKVTAEEPMLLGSMIDLKASFFLLKEDTTFLNRDFRIDFGYRTSPTTYVSFFSRRQAGDLLAVAQWAEADELPDIADFRYNNYGMNFIWNTLDDVFWPRRGSLSEMELGVGNKRLIQNTGLPTSLYQDIELNTLQYYLTLSLEKHIYLKRKWGSLLRVRAGELANENLLLNDLYRLGGLRSIRGFNENFFFANRYVYATFEPRFYLDNNSYFLVFTDMGIIQNKVGQGDTEWPFSFGGGISLDTDGGVFNFVYALGKSNSQRIGFNFSKIHFGYTGRF